ncbi:MAG TPA: hypothetical protein VGL05_06785 [Kribbella sp.]
MSGRPVRTPIRAAFVVCGLVLIAAAILIALRNRSDYMSVAALLTGVLLLVIGGTGRLPEEIGLQRVTFDPSSRASAYHQTMVELAQHELPLLTAIADEQRRLVIRGYWLDELDVPIVIIGAPEGVDELGQDALEAAVRHAAEAGGMVLLTNAGDIEQVRSVLRRRHGDRAVVVRWRSHRDNKSLWHAALGLSRVLSPHRKRPVRNR